MNNTGKKIFDMISVLVLAAITIGIVIGIISGNSAALFLGLVIATLTTIFLSVNGIVVVVNWIKKLTCQDAYEVQTV